MTPERCDECGFDGDAWTDAEALAAVAELPTRWRDAIEGLDDDELLRRPIPAMWSIAEYVDHVREVLFGMRFALDSAIGQPGIDLGEPPEPRFHSEPRRIDAVAASDGLDREARALVDRLSELSPEAWTAWATVGGQRVDAHWVVRHALHDATHHLLDVERLRATL